MAEEITALAEGYIVGSSVVVTPKDAQPGRSIHIKATFTNQSWLPAYGYLRLTLDGVVIAKWTELYIDFILFGGGESFVWEIDYTLPASIASGMSHRIEAREEGQTTITAYADFTVTSPAPPGQRNVSFSSIPAGANIYVSEGYIGNSPITIPLAEGTYAIRAVYTGQEITRNITVTTGAGTIGIEFTFKQETPFDLSKWVSDNKWTLIGTGAGLGLLYMIIKKPDTVRQGYEKAKEYSGKAYEKAKEALK